MFCFYHLLPLSRQKNTSSMLEVYHSYKINSWSINPDIVLFVEKFKLSTLYCNLFAPIVQINWLFHVYYLSFILSFGYMTYNIQHVLHRNQIQDH